MEEDSLLIGGAAKTLGIRPATLRHYERLGLLKAERNRIGQRVFTSRQITQARRILKARLASRNRGLRR